MAGRRSWLQPSIVGLLFFALYAATLAPDVVGHDAGEFQFVPAIFGIPHAPGYPLQLLAGKAFSFLPLGSVAWRMNLLSALIGASAAALTYLCGVELLGTWLGGLAAASIVGLAPLEWTWSTIAGIRSGTVAFVAAVVLAALRWEKSARQPNATKQSTPTTNRRLLIVALTFGLAMDHHRTIVLILPLLGAFILMVRRRTFIDVPLMLGAVGTAAAPLALYGMFFLMARLGTPWDQYHSGTWSGFLDLVLSSSDSARHLDLSPGQALARWPLLSQAFSGPFWLTVLALVGIGLCWLAARRPAQALLLGGYASIVGFFTLIWNVGSDLNLVFLMPAYVPLALLAAAGCSALIELAGRLLRPSSTQRPAAGAQLLGPALALSIAGLGLLNGRAHFRPVPETLDDFRVNLLDGHQARRLADAFASLPPNATVVGDWDQDTVLWYAQYIDHLNPTAMISYPATLLPSVLERAGGPVFLTTATVRPTGPVSAWGPFVEALRSPQTELPADVRPMGGSFDGQIQLAGFAPMGQPSYGVLPVTLYWKALQRPPADYAVSVRLMPSPDRVARQRDEAAPVLGLSPTSTWLPGQVTADYYELDVRSLPDGPYDLAVVLYQPLPGGYRNLAYGSTDRAVLGTVTMRSGGLTFEARRS